MNKNYANIFIGVLVTLVIVLGVAYFNVPKPTPPYGALPGPDISSPYLSVSGVKQWYFSSSLANGTTTLCSFKLPGATTTLLYANVKVSTGTTTGITWVDFGQDYANNTATTLQIGTSYKIPASALADIIASSTPTSGGKTTFSPSAFFNINYANDSSLCTAGGATACNAYKGSCKAVFVEE